MLRQKKDIDFSKPAYAIEGQDSDDIRQKILSISYTDWENMGFSKGTMYYMKKNAESDKPFTLNVHVRERLEVREETSEAKWCVKMDKETNMVKMQELESNRVETYYDTAKLREYILNLTPAEAREIGIKHRSTIKNIKDRVREREFKLDMKEMRKVLKKMSL